MKIESIQRFSVGDACVRCFAHGSLLYLVLHSNDGYLLSVCPSSSFHCRCSIITASPSLPPWVTSHPASRISSFFIPLSVLWRTQMTSSSGTLARSSSWFTLACPFLYPLSIPLTSASSQHAAAISSSSSPRRAMRHHWRRRRRRRVTRREMNVSRLLLWRRCQKKQRRQWKKKWR